MVEIGRQMVQRDQGWMEIALNALVRTKANLHAMEGRKLCALLPWGMLKDVLRKEAKAMVSRCMRTTEVEKKGEWARAALHQACHPWGNPARETTSEEQGRDDS